MWSAPSLENNARIFLTWDSSDWADKNCETSVENISRIKTKSGKGATKFLPLSSIKRLCCPICSAQLLLDLFGRSQLQIGKTRNSKQGDVCGLWSELPPNRQRREVGAAKAAAPAAKSARASSKQRPQLTTPWRREALGARPPPGTNSPTANQRQPGVRKGEPQNKQIKPNPRGSQRKPDHPRDPKREPTKTWQPQGRVHTGETKASKVARPSKRTQPPLTGTQQSRLTVAPRSTNFAPKQCQHSDSSQPNHTEKIETRQV